MEEAAIWIVEIVKECKMVLKKMMYAVCMFVESAMDFAESPEEKEIIRKHVQKLKNL